MKSIFLWVFWGAGQPIQCKTPTKAVVLSFVPALGWRGCREPLQELLLVDQRPMGWWMLVWTRILAGLWLWGCVLLCRQITACTQSSLFCISADPHVHQELRLDPSSRTASSFPFCESWLSWMTADRNTKLCRALLCASSWTEHWLF